MYFYATLQLDEDGARVLWLDWILYSSANFNTLTFSTYLEHTKVFTMC